MSKKKKVKNTEVIEERQRPKVPRIPRKGWANKADNPILKRHGANEDEDMFIGTYDAYGLLQPPYDFGSLYELYEESDLLRKCFAVYIDACVREYEFERDERFPLPDDPADGPDRRLRQLTDFFQYPNDDDSFVTIRRPVMLDTLAVGNGFFEILPRPDKTYPDLTYHTSPIYMRCTALEENPIPVRIQLPRNGALQDKIVFKRFRKFARWFPGGSIVWFKEWGDPRVLDRVTGEFVSNAQGELLTKIPYDRRASSILWMRNNWGGNTYGIPDWISALSDVRGRYVAKWVNHDLIDQGGIPPWLLLVYGRLARGDREYLEELMEVWNDPAYCSAPGIVEIQALQGMSQAGNKAGAEFVSMRDLRSPEGMWREYLAETDRTIGGAMRVPAVLRGIGEGQTSTSAYAELEVFEKYVAAPLRQRWDEFITTQIIRKGFGIWDWRIKTRRAPLQDIEILYKAMGMVGRTGGAPMNWLRQLVNDVFDMKIPPFEGEAYDKISSAELVSGLRAGAFRYDPETFEVIPVDPSSPAQAQKTDDQDSAIRQASLRIGESVAHEMITMIAARRELDNDEGYGEDEPEESNAENYEPPVISDDDYVM